MQETPTKSPEASLAEAQKTFDEWGIEYTKMPDGFLQVGDLCIAHMGLRKLPDLSRVKVFGGFNCENNWLTSLEGCPSFVGGTFNCLRNKLTSLEGAPEHTGQLFFSDFGSFGPSRHIPDELRISQETLVRRATVLQAPTTVMKPLRFKGPGA
jgi:hypothetical protein